MKRFKITEHKELRHNKIINVSTGRQVGVVVWAHKKDNWPNHIRITDSDKEFTNSDLLDLVNMMNFPKEYYEYKK